MPPKVQQKSKEAKAAAAAAGGKKGKKKWNKKNARDLANMEVLFAKSTYDKLLKEAPKVRAPCISSYSPAARCGARSNACRCTSTRCCAIWRACLCSFGLWWIALQRSCPLPRVLLIVCVVHWLQASVGRDTHPCCVNAF